MRTADFDFDLPEPLIALRPAQPRSSARLLAALGAETADAAVTDLPGLLRPGDLLVFNDSRVIPARLFGLRRRSTADGAGVARVEATLTARAAPDAWRALVRPARRLRPGDVIVVEAPGGAVEPAPEGGAAARDVHGGATASPLHDGAAASGSLRGPAPQGGAAAQGGPAASEPPGARGLAVPSAHPPAAAGLRAEVVELAEGGAALLRFNVAGAALDAAVAAAGVMPLPPYIARRRPADARDAQDYQTMFAVRDGSVAAPTAALHFDEPLMAALAARGVLSTRVTLHVGAGTFLPVKADRLSAHRMHAEWGEIGRGAAEAINAARAAGGRVIAVGTTALRLLESAAGGDGRVAPWRGETDIFIAPGYVFRAVDGLMTNFHLPRSTLFMLVCALMGVGRMRALYAHAIAGGYRFYSYGDASLLIPDGGAP